MENKPKTKSIRLFMEDQFNLNRIKYFWEKEDNTKYTDSDIIRICLDIIRQVEDENRKEKTKA